MNFRAIARDIAVGLRRFVTVLLLMSTATNAQELWFSAGDDLKVNGVVSHPEFPELLKPNSPWKVGLSHLNVLQFRAAYFPRKAAEGDAAEVATILDFLKAHNIALGITAPMMPSETCGSGTEGISVPRQIDLYARQLKALGAPLQYVVIDEPLYYAHEYKANKACELPIGAVAEGVARNVKAIRGYYPHAKFILVEPEQMLKGGPTELADFLDAYKTHVDEYPQSVRFDVQWQRNWQSELPPFIRMLHDRGIGYGIIYNAKQAPRDDIAWIASAKENALAFEKAIREKPDHVMIQSWNPNPTKILPENNPYTMTGFLKWYVEH
jgi:hypothetical protein